ncbi:T-cell receptor gamma alternate reading frame protein [Pogoniulus pusillus]|uniref:T-cell receptor gamma alternate reading frame protein n=1 Tax=Pogoniulus pusillus TaxID=488313 RepID=UPI0030B93E8C
MLLLTALIATASWSSGFAQEIPVQSPISITKFRKSARMTCELQAVSSLDSSVLHWYRQKEGEAPVRMLYFADEIASVESAFQADRYMVENVPGRSRCVLTISNVVPEDAATYYCAYWDRTYHKVFGSSTKLIVADQGNSPPVNSEILQKKHDDQITYVCLIEKFYPEVIRVEWTDGENKKVTDNTVNGHPWKHPKEDKYSISSWITVPAETKDKNYYCKYKHESQERSLSTAVGSSETTPQEGDCLTYPGNSTVFYGDHLMHRAAFLVYIILLLKSSMYYLIVLFFIYRMWAPTKHQGKKA